MARNDRYYDDLEIRDPAAREREVMAQLSAQVARAKERAPYYAEALKDVDPEKITSREALATLPVTRKHDLIELMKAKPPFGGLHATAMADAAMIFTSPGPIFEVATDAPDFYGAARAIWAAGFRPGDVIHNSFAYHLTPGAWVLHTGARAVGCPVIPAGIGNSEQQAAVIAQVRPVGYSGTPDYLKALIETGEGIGLDMSSIKRALVGGGPLFPALRKEYNERGIDVYQTFATAELGNVAHETEALEGMVVAEDKIVEVVVPGTGDPVPNDGDVGEMIVTTLHPDLPLLRFATGDMTAILPGASPCGRTNMRIKGWMGRADQTTKVRGMFVHPEQVAEVVKRHPEIARARLVVEAKDNRDLAIFRVEVPKADESLKAAVGQTFQAVCKVRGDVEFAEPGTLPNDGKVIEDVRDFSE